MPNFTIKIVNSCNLNCDYCSYFRSDYRPPVRQKIMPLSRVRRVLEEIKVFLEEREIGRVSILWHGGEPTLAGVRYFEQVGEWCGELLGKCHLENYIGSNATLIDDEWVRFGRRYSFLFKVSIDGHKPAHDAHRRDFDNQGSYWDVRRGIERLVEAGLCYQANIVVNPEQSGRVVFSHVAELGVGRIAFQIPESDHERPYHEGLTDGIARYLCEAFDAWWSARESVRVVMFETLAGNALGLKVGTRDCRFSGRCASAFTVEADGSFHSCDVLRNVPEAYEFEASAEAGGFARVEEARPWAGLRSGSVVPDACRSCHLYEVCKGYCTGTRYHPLHGFREASVYCGTMLQFLPHLIERVSEAQETLLAATGGVGVGRAPNRLGKGNGWVPIESLRRPGGRPDGDVG